ncbi:four-carbon acid sugar kinase family protein [Microbacterium halophytorum]|uniref:four-carbon acid sugar kinase family protein n=1 Tax=Microbacterium halophytorum TaxID=2067568 RepID=UPI000CFC4655|nr:four-carbon acid sugar kinase family protein [Microbacterium halophytorum]
MSSSEAALGIVADDLTGALDSAVKFARSGWNADLVLGRVQDLAVRTGSAFTVTTDARTQSADVASAATANAVRGFVQAGVERILVKIDSTIRGSVAAQIDGALAVWRAHRPNAIAVVCPAYPAMGRTVSGGIVHVDGVRVDRTWMADDPVTPVTDADLRGLLPNAAVLGAGPEEELAGRITQARLSGHDAVVVDAADEAALESIAAAARRLGPDAVLVGAAGIAQAFAGEAARGAGGQRNPDVARPLVIASSLHERTHEQLDRLIAEREVLQAYEPSLPDLRTDSDVEAWVAALPIAEVDGITILRTPTTRTSDDGAAVAVSARLALAADLIAARSVPDLLLLMGGEGARAVLRRIGAQRVQIQREIREGMPLGRVVGGFLDGALIITKAGGFGRPEDISDVLAELTGTTQERHAS